MKIIPILHTDENSDFVKESTYFLRIIFDVTGHYLCDDSRYDFDFRKGVFISAIVALLTQLLEDSETPEEVLQEYFLKAYQRLSKQLKGKSK
jgi:hypothetical protein